MPAARFDRVRAAVVLITVAGLAVTVALLASVGVGDVLAVLRRVGPLGFIAYCGVTLVILVGLGAAWAVLAPGEHLLTFIWGRTTREAATDVLPFAQFGGIVVGARSVVARGVAPPRAYASLVADQTTELAAQLVYTLYGVAALALALRQGGVGGELWTLAAGGLGISIAVMAGFAFAQRPLLAFAARIGAAILPAAAATLAGMRDELDRIYRMRARVAVSFALHIATWVGSGAGAWLGLRLLGIDMPVGHVVVVEALIFTVRTAAFVVPGGIGVQEGAYVLIGPVFGLPPEAALALSLLKRARDLAIGVPVLLLWQVAEGRGVLRGDGRL